MPRFEACLLDYGNTIVEFDTPQIRRVQAELTEALGRLVRPVPLETVSRCLDDVCKLPFRGDPPQYREMAPHDQMETLLGFIYGREEPFPLPLVQRCNEALQESFVQAITIDAATRDFLASLKERVRVGLVSNYPCGRALRRSLRLTGIDNLLDPVVVSGDLGFVKPHASLFETALDALGVPAEKVLFVGDRWDADMIGARDAGMKTCHHVGFTTDRDLEERYALYRPDHEIRRVQELEEILFDGRAASRQELGAFPPAG